MKYARIWKIPTHWSVFVSFIIFVYIKPYCRSTKLFVGYEAERCTTFDPHSRSACHLACVRQEEHKRDPSEAPAVLKGIHVGHDMDAGFETKMQNAFQVAYFVAKKERPLEDYSDLVELQERTGSAMPASYRSGKAAARLVAYHKEPMSSSD